MGRLELEFPTSSGFKSLGLRPSAFIDVGSLCGASRQPILTDIVATCMPMTGEHDRPRVQIMPDGPARPTCGDATGARRLSRDPGFKEVFLGNSPKPRLSIGIGVNWISPFGPLRLDIAKALLKQKGDDTKLFSFNVGTQF